MIQSGNFAGVQLHVIVTLICWGMMAVGCCIDLWSGKDAAKAVGEKIDSRGLRRTFTKVGDYWRVLLFALMFDTLGILFPWYLLPYTTMLVTAGILYIEARSVIENSRKKKSAVGKLPGIMEQIIKCVNEKDALELIHQIKGETRNESTN